MKNKSGIFVITLFLLFPLLGICQQYVTWQGGYPGQETKWDVAQNWSTNQVPTTDSHVIIKWLNSGHNAQPILNSSAHVASIEIQANGQLNIDALGELIVDGSNLYSEGIILYNGRLINNGTVRLVHIDHPLDKALFSGDGTVFNEALAQSE